VNQPTGDYRLKTDALDDLAPDDRDDLKRTGKILRNSPAITYFGLNIGYTF
jgi:hypothetical protein